MTGNDDLIIRESIQRYRAGRMPFPILVYQLEEAVLNKERAEDARAPLFRRPWVRLELVNVDYEGVDLDDDGRARVEVQLAEMIEQTDFSDGGSSTPD